MSIRLPGEIKVDLKMAGGVVELRNLLNQALGQPERGVVDFKMLKEFLMQFLIATKQVDFPTELLKVGNKDFEASEEKKEGGFTVQNLALTEGFHQDLAYLKNQLDSFQGMQDSVLKRLNKIEKEASTFATFDVLPSGEELLSKRRAILTESHINADGDDGNEAPGNEIAKDSVVPRKDGELSPKALNDNKQFLNNSWNNVRVNKRLQALEDGVDTLFSMVDILSKEHSKLKDVYKNDKEPTGSEDIIKLMAEIESLRNRIESNDRNNEFEKEIANIKSRMESVEDELKGFDRGMGRNNDVALDGLEKRLHELEAKQSAENGGIEILTNELKKIGEEIKGLVPRRELGEFVTWPALEDALNVRGYVQKQLQGKGSEDGERVAVDNEEVVTEKEGLISNKESKDEEEVEERKNKKDGDSLKENWPGNREEKEENTINDDSQIANAADKEKEIVTSPVNEPKEDYGKEFKARHPSAEMKECLRRLNDMASKYGEMESKVNAAFAEKTDHRNGNVLAEIEGLKESISSTNQTVECNKSLIDTIRADIDQILKRELNFANKDDTENLNTIKEHLIDLDEREERTSTGLNNLNSNMYRELKSKQQLIDALYECVNQLQRSKADVGDATSIFDLDAYKKALDTKVSMNDFDEMMLSLQKNIEDVLQRLDQYASEEESLKEALAKLNSNMQEKLDAKAEDSLKKYLESRIAQLQKSRENLVSRAGQKIMTNAAGFRRPLSTLFHCISCDRPVNHQGGAVLPSNYRVHKWDKKGGYTTFKQQSKSTDDLQTAKEKKRNFDVWKGPFSVTRPCGGNHTASLHNPKKLVKTTAFNRKTEVAQLSRSFIEERKRESTIVDLLLGTDGNVYRGRYKMTDLQFSKESKSHEIGRLRTRSAELRPNLAHQRNSPENLSNPASLQSLPRSLPPLEKEVYSMSSPPVSFRIAHREEKQNGDKKEVDH